MIQESGINPLDGEGLRKMRKTRLRKNSPRPIPKLKADVWKLFSLYIRLRIADKNGMVRCITCGVRKHYKQMDAGHFVDGRANYLLFDEKGVWPQCKRCNGGLIGRGVEGLKFAPKKVKETYEKFMLKKYGQKVIDELRTYKTRQFTRQELENLKAEFKVKLEKLERRQLS